MQTSHLDIYSALAKETEKSEQVFNDIGSFIFRETSRMLKEPTSLILKLKGVGSWHLRKKRLLIVVNEWTERAQVRIRDEFPSDMAYIGYLDKHLQYINFQERLKDYDRYITIKKQIREKRYETQIPVEPNNWEGQRFKSS